MHKGGWKNLKEKTILNHLLLSEGEAGKSLPVRKQSPAGKVSKKAGGGQGGFYGLNLDQLDQLASRHAAQLKRLQKGGNSGNCN